LANKFWPKDPRIKVENWDQINDATWFSKTPSPPSKGSKKKASTGSQVQLPPLGRAQGPTPQVLPIVQQATISTGYTGGHTKNTKPGSFMTGTPLSQVHTPTHTTGPINYQSTPANRKRKAEDEPEEAKPVIKKWKIAPQPYNNESLKKKQYFVWKGVSHSHPRCYRDLLIVYSSICRRQCRLLRRRRRDMSLGKNNTKRLLPRTVNSTK
jgi:hypothetical protein